MNKKIFTILAFFSLLSSSYALDLHKATQSAIEQNKLILLSVESIHCKYCKKMNKEVFEPKANSAKINTQYIQKIVMAEDVELPSNIKVQYYPTSFIINPKDMSVVDEFVGYMKSDDFLSLIDLVYSQEVQAN